MSQMLVKMDSIRGSIGVNMRPTIGGMKDLGEMAMRQTIGGIGKMMYTKSSDSLPSNYLVNGWILRDYIFNYM